MRDSQKCYESQSKEISMTHKLPEKVIFSKRKYHTTTLGENLDNLAQSFQKPVDAREPL